MSIHDHRQRAPRAIRVGILTVSDTRSVEDDESGALIRDLALGAGHTVVEHRVLPDDADAVRSLLLGWAGDGRFEALLVCGGTGISGRDTTFEAISAILDRRLDGFGELFRALSFQQIGSAAMLSRAVGGIVAGRPIFSMPGSPSAVRLAMEKLILPELGHVVSEASRKT
jgi:molybdopterin adenylyltransferase